MICSPDLSIVTNVVMFLKLIVAEPDQGQVNHLLQGRLDCGHRPIAVSYTGPEPIGKEGDWVKVRWTGTCQLLRTVTEDPYTGPMGSRSWLCTADTMER